jgi:IclR family KDG regulon transcriptional repressor
MTDSISSLSQTIPILIVDSTLSKGLMILEDLSASKKAKGVTELSKDLELTKSNTFRLLQTLTHLGYVQHNADKSYQATLKTWQVGRNTVDNLNLRELAAPQMRHLADETGETIYLAVIENLSIIYIDKIDSSKPIRSWNPIGGVAPLHCVGTGKAILAVNYGTLRDSVKSQLSQHTELTITDIDRLDKDVELSKHQGYAVDKGEFRDRIFSFGAAITLPKGDAIAALGISIPDVNMSERSEDYFGALVAHAAHNISEKLARI